MSVPYHPIRMISFWVKPQRRLISGNRILSSVAKMPFGTLIQIPFLFKDSLGVKLNKFWQYSRKAANSVGSSRFLVERMSFNESILISI